MILKNGQWHYRKNVRLPSGETIRVSGRADTKADAEAKLEEHITLVIKQGAPRALGRPTIGGVPRDATLAIHMPSNELAALQAIADRAGLSLSELGYRIITEATARAYVAAMRKQRREK